jgi:heme-degrading monooxygenase HmoA
MKVTFTVTSTKPADKVWFPAFSAENKQAAQVINAFTGAQPGFISQTTTNPDGNTRITVFEWASEEQYLAWFSGRNNLPEQQNRLAYNRANNIISHGKETLS